MNRVLAEVDVLQTVGDPGTAEITGVQHDSRRVTAGDLFVCLPGVVTDGHAYAGEAVARGATGVVCEHLVARAGDVVQARVRVGGARPALARAAAALLDHPSRDVTVVGVTGTNGKTTVTSLLAGILQSTGVPTTVVGTLTGERTTPEATELQRTLADARDARVPGGPRPAVAMEVSSHALAQSRVDAVDFDVAVFTNLSHDHLDFHHTMEAYWEAKASLFTADRARRGVVNADDPWGRRLLDVATIPLIPVRGDAAEQVRLEPGRSSFVWRGQLVVTALTGRANVDNALLAAESAVALGLEPAVVAAGLATAPVVPGRLELIGPAGRPPVEAGGALGGEAGRAEAPTVMVDYAHTPAALRMVLQAATRLRGPGGRVVVVFGCGGERDRAKRPLMGAAADSLATMTFLTSDNPRHDDPLAIIDQVRSGFAPGAEQAGRLVVEPDRRRAIERAVAGAGPGDVVVVAGKGHEAYQQVGDERLPFDDRVVAAAALAARLES